ncbi:MAG: hypothetical protein RH945_06250 [Hyphomonas sp.]
MANAPTNISQAFVTDNARNESSESILSSFIAPDIFWELFSPHHHIILGSRGSGKTSVARMASFPFLSKSRIKRARALVSQKEFIGVFVNTDIRFVGSTKENFLHDRNLSGTYFVWKFNLNCLKSLSATIDSVLDNIFGATTDRYEIEREVSNYITDKLLGIGGAIRLAELDDAISEYEFECRSALNAGFLSGDLDAGILGGAVSAEIFEPISAVVRQLNRSIAKFCKHSDQSISLEDTNWLFFVDEAEYLAEDHIKILNSYMRTHTGKIFLKIATLPFKHKTLETNLAAPLQVDDDFFYKSLDRDPIYSLNNEATPALINFASNLYAKRVRHFISSRGMALPPGIVDLLLNFEHVVGQSPLEQPRPLPLDLSTAISEISDFVDATTLARAEKLRSNRAEFGNQIWRKLSGIITLIEDKKLTQGQKGMSVYSGVETCIRCTDGVPRRMINLFHGLSQEAFRTLSHSTNRVNRKRSQPVLSSKQQTRIVKAYSLSRVSSSLAVPDAGPELREMIECIARYFELQIHDSKISTDVVASFSIPRTIDPATWAIVKEGIAYGYIFRADKNVLPTFDPTGTYRLAYALCPHYDLFPRKGKARSLSSIIRSSQKIEEVQQLSLELGFAQGQSIGNAT